MKRITTAVLAGATVATLAYASASALQVDSKPLQAGSATVTCDVDGVNVNWGLEIDDNSVRSVTVSDIDGACFGTDAKLFVAVNGVAIPGDGMEITKASEKIAFSPFRTPESINDIKVWIG